MSAFRAGEKWANSDETVGFPKVKGWDPQPFCGRFKMTETYQECPRSRISDKGNESTEIKLAWGVERDWVRGPGPDEVREQRNSGSEPVLCSGEAAVWVNKKRLSSRTTYSAAIWNFSGQPLTRGGGWSFLRPWKTNLGVGLHWCIRLQTLSSDTATLSYQVSQEAFWLPWFCCVTMSAAWQCINPSRNMFPVIVTTCSHS